MTIELAIVLLAVPVFWAFAEWRLGLLLCLATAILQDPLRKLTPDQSVLFIGFVGVVFAAAFMGALVRGVSMSPYKIFGSNPRVREASVDFADIDYSGGIQFLRSVWQSRNFTNWITDIFVAVTCSCLRLSTCCSRRLSACISIYESLRRLHRPCADNSLFGIRRLRLARVRTGWGQSVDVRHICWSNYTAFRHVPSIRNRSVACNGMCMFNGFANDAATDQFFVLVNCDGCCRPSSGNSEF